MRRWAVGLFASILTLLLIATPAVADTDDEPIEPGEWFEESFTASDPATLKAVVNLTVGSSVTLIILDETNYELFKAGSAYEALHESTTSDHLTYTDTVPAGTWYVLLVNNGSGDIEVSLDLSWSSGGGSFFVDLPVLAGLLVALAAVVVVVLLVVRKGRA